MKPLKTKINNEQLQQVRIIPKINQYNIEVIYNKTKEIKYELDKKNYMSIDLGVNNLCAITSNKAELRPILIKGGIIKNINQYYNKEKAKMQSKLIKNKRTSKAIQNLTTKRNNKVSDFYHHVSKLIIQTCIANDIGNIVIGINRGWKQEVKIGKRNNQNFVQISHSRLVDMIRYKAEEYGIEVLETKEQYTSKCSALDFEEVCKHDEYIGKRIKRGLFKSLNSLVNADVNGSLNILRKAKVINDDFIRSLVDRGCVLQPIAINSVYNCY